MAKVFEQISGHATHQLPASFSREIGRIIVKWAFFEQCVQEMVWDTLGLSDAAGRIAVREPRVTDRLEMLRDVFKLKNARWDDALYKSIHSRANLFAAKRHMLVHGTWFHHKPDAEWHVQLVRGAWPKDAGELAAKSKKVEPESVTMTMEILRSTTSEIQVLFDDLNKLRASAVAPASSLGKPA